MKSLVATPDVLSMMSTKLDWTQKLGDAVLAQQPDVMDAIQRLRTKADANKKLTSTKQQKVTKKQEQGKQVIVIEPTEPNTLYVPYYDPGVVYGGWPYPAYPPYYFPPPGYIGAGIIATGIAFGAGYALGRWASGGNYWGGGVNWGGNNININRPVNINNSGNNWQHRPEHRGGVRYNNGNVQQKFGNNNIRGGSQNRNDFRGRGGDQVLKPGGGGEQAIAAAAIVRVPAAAVPATAQRGQRAAVRTTAECRQRPSGGQRPQAGRAPAARGRAVAATPLEISDPAGLRALRPHEATPVLAAAVAWRRRRRWRRARRRRRRRRGGGGGGGGVVAAVADGAQISRSSTTSSCLAISTTALAYYRFSYNGSERAYVGVMAQEVQIVAPDAVVRGQDGYLRVYYDKLGVKFQTYRAMDRVGRAGACRWPCLTLICLRESTCDRGCHEQNSYLIDG